VDWINLALLSATILGVVNIIDSHLLSKRMPSLRAFLLPVGIIILIFGLVVFYISPLPEGTSLLTLLVAIASGICRAAGVTIMFYTLKREEVSRVIPVVYTYPIFVAIMAVPLLGESLHYLEWLAIVMIVAGAVMVSVRQSPSGSITWLDKSFLFLFGSSLLLALADIASKYVLAYISVWNLFWLSTFCLSGGYLLISVRTRTFKQLSNIKQKNSVIGLVILDETLAMLGIMLAFWAIQKGPVSLVSTIIGSRPIFVVIFALMLSHILPGFLEWNPGRGMLALRLMATALIVGGIAIINLT